MAELRTVQTKRQENASQSAFFLQRRYFEPGSVPNETRDNRLIYRRKRSKAPRSHFVPPCQPTEGPEPQLPTACGSASAHFPGSIHCNLLLSGGCLARAVRIFPTPYTLYAELCVFSRREEQMPYSPRSLCHCAVAHGRAAAPPPSRWRRGGLLGHRDMRHRRPRQRRTHGPRPPHLPAFARLLGGLHPAPCAHGAACRGRMADSLALAGRLHGPAAPPAVPDKHYTYI